jgi:hypothetical protein
MEKTEVKDLNLFQKNNRVAIAQSVKRRATGWTAGVRFTTEERDFALFHSVLTRAGAHPAFYPMGTGALSSGVKQPRLQADHSPAYSAEVKKGGAISPCLIN